MDMAQPPDCGVAVDVGLSNFRGLKRRQKSQLSNHAKLPTMTQSPSCEAAGIRIGVKLYEDLVRYSVLDKPSCGVVAIATTLAARADPGYGRQIPRS